MVSKADQGRLLAAAVMEASLLGLGPRFLVDPKVSPAPVSTQTPLPSCLVPCPACRMGEAREPAEAEVDTARDAAVAEAVRLASSNRTEEATRRW